MDPLRFKRYQIGNTGGIWTQGSLVDLLLAMPYLIDDFVPPLRVLNDLLLNGVPNYVFPNGLPNGKVQYDAGMSGGCAWKPFQISQQEYEELVLEIVTSPTMKVQAAEPPDTIQTISQWRQWELAQNK